MKFPIKQKIPLILLLALSFWATCAITYWYSQFWIYNQLIQQYFNLIIALIFVCFIVSVIIILLIKNIRIAFISVILLGFMLSIICSNSYYSTTNKAETLNSNNYSIEILEDQKNGSINNSAVAKLVSENITYKVKVNIDNNYEEEVHAGDILTAYLKFTTISDSNKENYWQNGININAWASQINKQQRNDLIGIIYGFRNKLIQTIRDYEWDNIVKPEQLLNAIICGQRIDINSGDLYNTFRNCGLAHLVAVSGAHLSLVTALLVLILKKLKLKKWQVILIQSFFIFAYLICAAIPISALRAALMTYIAIYSFFGKKRPAPLNAIGICIFVLLSINPQTSVSVSFVLSASSTIGIILFARLFEYVIGVFVPKMPSFINNALALTISSSICSLPISVAIFNQLPLISPIANILTAPIFTILCATGLISSVFATIFNSFFPITSYILMNFCMIISQIMIWIVELLTKIPYACIPAKLNIYLALLLSITICILIQIFWNKFKKLKRKKWSFNIKNYLIPTTVIASLICLFIFIPKSSDTELIMLDVGQGDSIYLKSKESNFLIDTGNQDNKLKSNFAELGITHLDGILITHPDDDHCGSLDVIKDLIDVSKVYIAADLLNSNNSNCKKLVGQIKDIVNKNDIVSLNVGDKISFGEYELDVIWPDKYSDEGGNCDSLTVIANVDINNDGDIESRVLLCGDAEKSEINQMFKKSRIPKIDIYKCGHHGSKNAIDEQAANLLKPKITLISVGAKNRYGHPSQNTISMLENANSKIYRTDKSGTIFCSFDYGQINIKTEK